VYCCHPAARTPPHDEGLLLVLHVTLINSFAAQYAQIMGIVVMAE